MSGDKMNKFLLGLTLLFFFTISSTIALADHCAGGHDKATETSTSTSEESEEKEKK
tara:strand:+ start:78 stop:245 length:168 start_codon:yes stop_codon:yes gene_type:complete